MTRLHGSKALGYPINRSQDQKDSRGIPPSPTSSFDFCFFQVEICAVFGVFWFDFKCVSSSSLEDC